LIKATRTGKATVIIAVTASALEEDREVILAEGCDDYIRKPFREEEIFRVLSEFLGVRFTYEDGAPGEEAGQRARQPQPSQLAGVGPDDAELASRLAALPAAWAEGLRQATILGDLDLILARIRTIGENDPGLADALTVLAKSYEHDRILALLTQAGSAT